MHYGPETKSQGCRIHCCPLYAVVWNAATTLVPYSGGIAAKKCGRAGELQKKSG
jgi:hypothetical protein